MRRLSKGEYDQTMSVPMQRIGTEDTPPFDFWDYFESIPQQDFQGFDCSAGEVDNAYNEATGRYQHILINSDEKNVFMVLILDLNAANVYGHMLLDLNEAYGLNREV